MRGEGTFDAGRLVLCEIFFEVVVAFDEEVFDYAVHCLETFAKN